ncbi:MAG: Holliday junction branch migration protein RuvA [Methylococcales bacterium]|jgi:holliday junction DNA helicase RuvA|nr:Holliday junction branch migration protein RuvA [Methylococcales bacterium]
MIGFLRGTVVNKQPPLLLLDVQGVGYEVNAPMSTFYVLPSVGENVQVLTHLAIREDAHVLYGFAAETERQLFRSLIKVNGVGAKLALTVLSGMSYDEFSLCVHNKDAAALVRLPGIGKKTAERLLIELQDKVGVITDAGTVAVGGVSSMAASPVQDALSALEALGYKPVDAVKMVKKVETDGVSSDEIIRQALRAISGGR